MESDRKVLVIDDDAAAGRLIKEVLTRLGVEVMTSADPHAGLETAEAYIPDLIFINLLLPGTNGLKMSKAIHALKDLEKVPVIMLISHPGELDPKYTVTIGILDTLVKPLKEAEIIEKTKAILGDDAVTEPDDRAIGSITVEKEIDPMIFHEEEEMTGEAAPALSMEMAGEADKELQTKEDAREPLYEMTKEGEARMQEKENSFNKKKDDDRNLFSDESEIFREEPKKPHAEEETWLKQEEDSRFSDDELDMPYEEEKPASPVKRILLIAASIVVGLGLGVGGYFFFTAGDNHTPVEKQVANPLTEPAPVPAPPVTWEKPRAIPEIPVKAEPQKNGEAQVKDPKPQESLPKAEPKKEALQKTEAVTPRKETAPVAASKEKKPIVEKKPARKVTPAADESKQAYYVQTGLFEKEANAVAMAEKLKKKGYPSSVNKIETNDKKILFRVVAGTYGNAKKAVEVSKALNKQGIKALVRKQ